jgi:hypothetical protein
MRHQKKKPSWFKITQAVAGDVFVSVRNITSGESFLTLTLKLRTAEARVSPRQFQDKSFMVEEVAQLGTPL